MSYDFRVRMIRDVILVVIFSVPGVVPGALAQQQDLREAARLDQEGKCDEAEPHYRRALSAGKPSAAILNNVGNHYLACGQPAKARTYFEQLLAANPDHPNANLQLARIATEKKQGNKALGYLSRIQDSGPAVSLLRAEALYWSGKHAEASAALDAVEKFANNDPRVLFTLGLTAARLGLYDRAEAAFEAVLRQAPGNFDVLLNLGRAAARAEHYERAQSALETALKVRPGDVDALFELGLAHAARQDSSRAVFLLAQARQKAPKRPDILLALARASEDAEYYGDAALAFDEYLELRPSDDTARRDRARVCARTEARHKEGLKELVWYLGKHPGDARAHYDLAHLIWEEEPDRALDELAAAVRLDPEFAAAHVSLAWLLHRLGRTSEAVPHLEAAIRIQPGSVRALDQLGLAYLALDKPLGAEKVLRRALAVGPDDPEVLLHLGRALAALDRAEEAEVYLEKFRKVRPAIVRGLRTEAGMIELASLPPAERRRRQIDRFRQMASARPDDSELKLHLAELLLADGKVEEALHEFRDLLHANAGSEIQEKAGRELLSVGEFALAREFLGLAVAERPSARLDLATGVLETEGPEQALRVIDEMPADDRNGDYFLHRAGILDAAGRTEEAIRVLKEGLGGAPARPDAARKGAALLVRRGYRAEAMELLERAIESAPDDPDLLLTKAVVLALMDREDDSAGILENMEARWPEWDRAYLVHGLLLERQNKPHEAKRKIQIAGTLNPKDAAAGCALARLAGTAESDPRCECVRGLYEVIVPACQLH